MSEPKHRAGRPPLDRTYSTVRLCVSVTTKTYDDLDTRARAARVNLSEFIRQQLRAADKPPKSAA
jgi:hypothetical protein